LFKKDGWAERQELDINKMATNLFSMLEHLDEYFRFGDIDLNLSLVQDEEIERLVGSLIDKSIAPEDYFMGIVDYISSKKVPLDKVSDVANFAVKKLMGDVIRKIPDSMNAISELSANERGYKLLISSKLAGPGKMF